MALKCEPHDDPETSFVIMNKRPLTNTAHEAKPSGAVFFNTLSNSGGKNNGKLYPKSH